MKYDLKDFDKVANYKVTADEMAQKYGVSKKTFIRAMNSNGYYLKKIKFKITSPYKTKYVHSYFDCANELNVSVETIRRAVKGKKIKIFEELGIKVEVVR